MNKIEQLERLLEAAHHDADFYVSESCPEENPNCLRIKAHLTDCWVVTSVVNAEGQHGGLDDVEGWRETIPWETQYYESHRPHWFSDPPHPEIGGFLAAIAAVWQSHPDAVLECIKEAHNL